MSSTPKKVFSVNTEFSGKSKAPAPGGQSNALLRELLSQNEENAEEKIVKIPVNKVISIDNPRRKFDETSLRELAANIKEYGLLNPITVRKIGEDFNLIAGERRLKAFKINNATFIPAVIKSVHDIDPERIPEYKIIENIQREDLTDLEIALSLNVIKDRQNLSASQLSQKFNKSLSWVKHKLSHASMVNNLVKSGKISNVEVIGKIPTSVLIHALPSLKSNTDETLKLLLSESDSRPRPTQAEVRKLSKKTNLNNGAKTKKLTVSKASIEQEIATIEKEIKTLQNRKKRLKAQLDKL
ncbi:ParB/RepB/Spo0J family partition protein [Leptospira barantonii]|uniref:ParB/RepB/Spo0J family partition protein n=1 Tax=Leptospira barantonii TaxID=2023184 RepID=A0A5F2BGX1_9LEPT|nr:ParB/RepB/Spo0J family partition protein [Leptospira barantonii]TGM04825.1 ParB/RepB/Spo0J family partition protein [Leptospira barantonii]